MAPCYAMQCLCYAMLMLCCAVRLWTYSCFDVPAAGRSVPLLVARYHGDMLRVDRQLLSAGYTGAVRQSCLTAAPRYPQGRHCMTSPVERSHDGLRRRFIPWLQGKALHHRSHDALLVPCSPTAREKLPLEDTWRTEINETTRREETLIADWLHQAAPKEQN